MSNELVTRASALAAIAYVVAHNGPGREGEARSLLIPESHGIETSYEIGRRAYREGGGMDSAWGMLSNTSAQDLEDYRRGYCDERDGLVRPAPQPTPTTECARDASAQQEMVAGVRKCWSTDGGYRCTNCGHVLTDHVAQRYCPAPSAQQDEREARTLADWLRLAPATWDSEYANLWAQLQVAQERIMEYRARWKGAQQVQAGVQYAKKPDAPYAPLQVQADAAVPGYRFRNRDGGVWVIKPPSGDEWAAFPGTPAHALIEAMQAAQPAPATLAEQAIAQLQRERAVSPASLNMPLDAALRAPHAAPATGDEREAFEAAMRETYQMVDPLNPPPAGSYARGEHNGIVAALKTLRENFEQAIAAHRREDQRDAGNTRGKNA